MPDVQENGMYCTEVLDMLPGAPRQVSMLLVLDIA